MEDLITIQDLKKHFPLQKGFFDRLLAKEKVRYIGDEVAAVAGVDEDTVKEALKRIVVEYEEIPAVFDPEEAMREGAPLVHENVKQNIARIMRIRHGDVTKAGNRQRLHSIQCLSSFSLDHQARPGET